MVIQMALVKTNESYNKIKSCKSGKGTGRERGGNRSQRYIREGGGGKEQQEWIRYSYKIVKELT